MAAATLAALACSCALVGCDDERGGVGRPLRVVARLGEVGLSPGQFSYPRALDADGRYLWVIDKTARVQRLDPQTGRCVDGWTMPEYALGKPTGVTVASGPHGLRVFVPDTHYHRVMVYDAAAAGADPRSPAPAPVARFGAYGEGPGQFIYPTDVAVLPGLDGEPERIYVSEYGGNDRVSVFDGEYRFLFSFGRFGDSDSAEQVEFNRPQALAIDERRGEIIVVDACNHRLGRFTLDGELVAWIGSADEPGEGLGRFRYPYGLTLLEDGTALVAEFGNHRVQRVDLETGRGLGAYGTAGRGEGELANPWGVAVIGKTAYVLDSGNNRVLGFEAPAAAAGWGFATKAQGPQRQAQSGAMTGSGASWALLPLRLIALWSSCPCGESILAGVGR